MKELCFYPAGVHGHHTDARGFEFPVHAPAITEHKGLGGTVSGDIGHRLEGRQAIQLQNVAATAHVRQHQTGHGHQSLAVEVNHAAFIFHGNSMIAAKFTETGCIHQQLYLRLLLLQKRGKAGKAVAIAQIQGHGPHRNSCLQFLEGTFPPGNGPNLIHLDILGKLHHKFPAHAGGCTGDNGNFHRFPPDH